MLWCITKNSFTLDELSSSKVPGLLISVSKSSISIELSFFNQRHTRSRVAYWSNVGTRMLGRTYPCISSGVAGSVSSQFLFVDTSGLLPARSVNICLICIFTRRKDLVLYRDLLNVRNIWLYKFKQCQSEVNPPQIHSLEHSIQLSYESRRAASCLLTSQSIVWQWEMWSKK